MRFKHWLRLGLSAALLSSAAWTAPVYAQINPASLETTLNSALSTQVHDWVNQTGFSGNVQVVRGETVLYEGAFGMADLEAGHPVDRNTAYQIASLSKGFTAVLVLQAVEAGQLQLDDPVSQHLPEFDAPYADQLTVRHLLQNRTGLPHYVDLPDWFEPSGKARYTQEVLLDTVASMPLRFEPGSDYYYSNVNYYLLGLILDEIGSAPYETQLSAQILEPVGLENIGQIYQRTDETPLAVNYLPEDGQETPSVIDIVNPAIFRATASLYAPASDLVIWGQAMLGEGLINEDTRAVLFDPEHPMSWTIAQIPVGEAQTLVEARLYSGRIAGHSSLLTLVPATGDVIVITGNNGVGYNALASLTVQIASLLPAETR